MKWKDFFSPETIIGFEELKNTNLNSNWGKYFIIKVLNTLVNDGSIRLVTNKVYITSALFEQYNTKITDALIKRKGFFSLGTIKNFKELKDLNLNKEINGNTQWSEYFIIQALNPLVEDGSIIKESFSDDPLDKNQYGSKDAKIKSRDANSIPGLALDD
jgi:hypothetical protein